MTDTWSSTFPVDPLAEPGKYFNRVTIVALSAYCHIRKVLPESCFKFRKIDGIEYAVFNQNVPGGAQFFKSIVDLSDLFIDKKVVSIRLAVMGKTGEHIESIKLGYNYDVECPPGTVLSSPLGTNDDVKTVFQHELDNLKNAFYKIPPLEPRDYPIRFRFVVDTHQGEVPSSFHIQNDPVNDISIGHYKKDDLASFEVNDNQTCVIGIETRKMTGSEKLTTTYNPLNSTINSNFTEDQHSDSF